MDKISCVFIIVQIFHLILSVKSHGYLADPPARSSAWLFDNDFSKCCQYYEHNQMFCGGTQQQWVVNGGKCSICGEAYDLQPKLFGVGDSMYLGKIVRTYVQGSIIPVTIVLTANHRGIFEFRLCNIDDDPTKDATQTCLDSNLLKITNGTTEYSVSELSTTIHINLTLPTNMLCKHCVFQWKYRTGNSWGMKNGKACLGCGKENEEFYGCADIAIVKPGEQIVNPTQKPSLVNPIIPKQKTIKPKTTNRKCTTAVIFSRTFDLTAVLDTYCQTICSNDCSSDNTPENEILYNGCVKSCDKLCACQ